MSCDNPDTSPRMARLCEVLLVAFISGWFCIYQLRTLSFGLGHFDEIMHAKVVQEMVHRGNYLTPTMDGKPYSNKPPFKMWMTATAVKLLGESTFSYRIVDGLAGVSFFTLFFFYCRRVSSSSLTAWLSFAALLSCSQLFAGHGIREGTQDGMLNLLMLGTLMSAHGMSNALLAERRGRALALALLSGLLFGMAILTKSAGAFIVLPVIGVFLLLNGALWKTLKRGRFVIVAGVCVATVVVGSYLLARFSEERSGSWRIMWRNEVVKRAVSGFHNRDNPLFYWNSIVHRERAVPPEVLFLSLAWAVFFLVKKGDRRYALPIAWAIVPVVCYSFIKSRLPWYIQFSYPGMALLSGMFCAALATHSGQALRRARSGGVRNLLVGAVSLAVLIFCCREMYGSIAKTTRALAQPNETIMVDRIVSALRARYDHESGRGRVFTVRGSFPSLREERLYWGMIGNRKLPVKKLPAVLDNPDLRVLIVEMSRFNAVAKTRPPVGVSLFRPSKKRTGWTVAMFYDPEDVGLIQEGDVIPVVDEISFASESIQPQRGFSSIEIEGRSMRGATASHVLELIPGARVELEYEVSVPVDTGAVDVEARVSDTLIGSARVSGTSRQTISFSIPEGLAKRRSTPIVFQRSQSNVGAARDEAPLVFHRLRRRIVF